MRIKFLTRRQTVAGEEVQEPTLLAMGLTVVRSVALLCLCLVAIVGMPAFGYTWWTFTAVAAILVGLVVIHGRKTLPRTASLSGRRRWHECFRGWARRSFITALVCWLGLIVWSEFSPGGPVPPVKADPDYIRVVSWNIHCGQDKGPPWKQFDWRQRKHALEEALDQARPDILCVQEATSKQVKFLQEVLPDFGQIGVGSYGKSSGEYCSIYFNRERFTELDGDTFWLQEPFDQPAPGMAALKFNRICTWGRLRDQVSGRTFRVYNTHFSLNKSYHQIAAQVIAAQIAAGDPTDAILLAGDFNASPSASSLRLIRRSGLQDSAVRSGKPAGEPTFQAYGIGLRCIDGIFVDSKWRVPDHRVLTVKPKNIFPSDHFAVLADLTMVE